MTLTTVDGSLDVVTLHKGDYITPDSLEEYLEAKRGTPRYGLGAMALCERIQRESAKEGRPLLVRSEDYGIRILTDPDAVEYKRKRHRQLCSGLERTASDLSLIDRSQLSADELRVLEHEEIRQSRVVQAVRKEIEALGSWETSKLKGGEGGPSQ